MSALPTGYVLCRVDGTDALGNFRYTPGHNNCPKLPVGLQLIRMHTARTLWRAAAADPELTHVATATAARYCGTIGPIGAPPMNYDDYYYVKRGMDTATAAVEIGTLRPIAEEWVRLLRTTQLFLWYRYPALRGRLPYYDAACTEDEVRAFLAKYPAMSEHIRNEYKK